MLKADKRAVKRQKARYGQQGTGASHTRETSQAELRRHIEKARKQIRRQERNNKNLVGVA